MILPDSQLSIDAAPTADQHRHHPLILNLSLDGPECILPTVSPVWVQEWPKNMAEALHTQHETTSANVAAEFIDFTRAFGLVQEHCTEPEEGADEIQLHWRGERQDRETDCLHFRVTWGRETTTTAAITLVTLRDTPVANANEYTVQACRPQDSAGQSGQQSLEHPANTENLRRAFTGIIMAENSDQIDGHFTTPDRHLNPIMHILSGQHLSRKVIVNPGGRLQVTRVTEHFWRGQPWPLR